MDNKYVKHAKISEAKFRHLVRLFALDLTATQIAELTNLNRNTVNKYLKGIRKRIAEYCHMVMPPALQSLQTKIHSGEKVVLLGILEYKGSIFSRPLQSKKAEQIKKKLKNQEQVGELTNSSTFSVFDMLLEPTNYHRIRLFDIHISQGKVRKKSNRIEGFLGYTQTRLEKFKGMHEATFWLHWKECEFRYNHSSDELYHLILKIIRINPLF